jgi:hypothetical protein
MLRLLAKPKITAVFCESLTSAPAKNIFSNQFSVPSKARKPRRVYQPRLADCHSLTSSVMGQFDFFQANSKAEPKSA